MRERERERERERKKKREREKKKKKKRKKKTTEREERGRIVLSVLLVLYFQLSALSSVDECCGMCEHTRTRALISIYIRIRISMYARVSYCHQQL